MPTSQQNSKKPTKQQTREARIANAAVVQACVVHDMKHPCPACAIDASRNADVARMEADRADAQARMRLDAIEKRIGSAAIPRRFAEYSFDTIPNSQNGGTIADARITQVCNKLRAYAAKFPALRPRGVSILLVGSSGTGKTGLACSIANAVMRDHGMTAMFMSSYGAVRHQRDTWGRKGKTEREALDDLVGVDLLVLDDVGTSVGSDSEMAMLFEVINGRYAARAPTILTSNLPLDDWHTATKAEEALAYARGMTIPKRPGLRTFLGPRVIDRFNDDGSFTLAMDWPSLRGSRA